MDKDLKDKLERFMATSSYVDSNTDDNCVEIKNEKDEVLYSYFYEFQTGFISLEKESSFNEFADYWEEIDSYFNLFNL